MANNSSLISLDIAMNSPLRHRSGQASASETERARGNRGCLSPRETPNGAESLEGELQRELNDARRLASCDDRRSRRRRGCRAACLPEDCRGYGRGTVAGIARILEVHMVKHIEELRSELQSEPLGEYEVLERSKIEVPVVRASERVATQITILARSRNARLAAV